jgi:hypothetical protein
MTRRVPEPDVVWRGCGYRPDSVPHDPAGDIDRRLHSRTPLPQHRPVLMGKPIAEFTATERDRHWCSVAEDVLCHP